MSARLPAGALLLTPEDCRILYAVARISDLRNRHRVGDTTIYRLLTEISVAAQSASTADGILPRHSSASEEPGMWTVNQLARATGRAERTIRLDCQRGELTARKVGRNWVIPAESAETYARGRARR